MLAITKEITGENNEGQKVRLEELAAQTIAGNFNNFLINSIPNILQKVKTDSYRCNILSNRKSMFLEPVTSEKLCEMENKHIAAGMAKYQLA